MLIHCHLVVLLLLLNKHVSMVSREGVEDKEFLLLVPNSQFIVILEVVL